MIDKLSHASKLTIAKYRRSNFARILLLNILFFAVALLSAIAAIFTANPVLWTQSIAAVPLGFFGCVLASEGKKIREALVEMEELLDTCREMNLRD